MLTSNKLDEILRSSEASFLFHSDPEVVMVGFSWDNSDERKMMSTFDFGRRSFGRFVDLAVVAQVILETLAT